MENWLYWGNAAKSAAKSLDQSGIDYQAIAFMDIHTHIYTVYKYTHTHTQM